MFNLVFFEPEIPQNTGAAGRLCLATGSTLHLIKPLGFSLDDKAVRRAGLDYWKEVPLKVWDSLPDLQAAHPESRFWLLSTKASRAHWDASFQEGDFFLFGPESRGLPETLLKDHPEQTLKIPMQEASTRSLNVATSAAIVLYEAWRQTQ